MHVEVDFLHLVVMGTYVLLAKVDTGVSVGIRVFPLYVLLLILMELQANVHVVLDIMEV